MSELKKDLSDFAYAQESRNRIALVGISIMNLVLAVAYFLEVVKGSRSIGSYMIIASLCVLPEFVK